MHPQIVAISDLHLTKTENWAALADLPPQPDDWLIVAGDVSSHAGRFEAAMALLAAQFGQVFWTPGNHDLWSHPKEPEASRGVFKYNHLVAICRRLGVRTPEDPYLRWPGDGQPLLIAPIFTLYDYSFRPDDVPPADALAWAAASGVVCNDEYLLHSDPFPSRQAWCAARCRYTERRLEEAATAGRLLLAGHFPLRRELARLRRIPRFSIWCGTRRTEDWHRRFPVTAVIYGHLHIRTRRLVDGVLFEEVSLGYPHQWQPEQGIAGYLRRIIVQ